MGLESHCSSYRLWAVPEATPRLFQERRGGLYNAVDMTALGGGGGGDVDMIPGDPL